MKPFGTLLAPLLLMLLASSAARCGQDRASAATTDSDHDGLSDALENRLLLQFSPAFLINRTDCSTMPASFVLGAAKPTVWADDGTIYGQAFPRKGQPGEVELHYFHLWRRDCGELSHSLDTEHVSALVRLQPDGSATALFWYTSAHEDTVCDASYVARAHALQAENRGATVWISPGKHASFFSEQLCTHGCGGDRCHDMVPLRTRALIDLGEPVAPMNGIAWLLAPDWPLEEKMRRSDFSAERLARVEHSQAAEGAWANPSKRPAQAAILGLNTGIDGAAAGGRATGSALSTANGSVGGALTEAATETGKALHRSSRNVLGSLQRSAKKIGLLPERN